jgi:Terpene cyclase DEP1
MVAGDLLMNRKHLYLLFCVLGLALPYSQFLPWVLENGLQMKLFVQQLFANRIGGFFGMDVLVSAVVLIFFIRREGQRLGVRHLWLPIAGVLTVGVSLGLPLFLYLRERALESVGGAVATATVAKTP